MTFQQQQDLQTCLIIIGCCVGVLLLAYLFMRLFDKKEKVAFKNNGDSPGDMFVGNGIGMRILGGFHRNFQKAVDRDEYYNRKGKDTKAPSPSDKGVLSGDSSDRVILAIMNGMSIEEFERRLESDPVFAQQQVEMEKRLRDKGFASRSKDSAIDDAYGLLAYRNRLVGYEFFCLIVPLIPVGCYAYEIELQSSRRTRYRFYGSQKWYLSEVLFILLTGWAGVGIVGSIIAIIFIFV